MSGVVWAAQALGFARRRRRSPTRIFASCWRTSSRIARAGGAVRALEDATLNDSAGGRMSQETRDMFHSIRDFLCEAAKELAERDATALANQAEFHTTWVDDETYPASKRAEFKAGLSSSRKRRALDPAALLNDQELPGSPACSARSRKQTWTRGGGVDPALRLTRSAK